MDREAGKGGEGNRRGVEISLVDTNRTGTRSCVIAARMRYLNVKCRSIQFMDFLTGGYGRAVRQALVYEGVCASRPQLRGSVSRGS